jgi:hypothetical protein
MILNIRIHTFNKQTFALNSVTNTALAFCHHYMDENRKTLTKQRNG